MIPSVKAKEPLPVDLEEKEEKSHILWHMVAFFAYLHVAAFYGFYLCFSTKWQTLLFASFIYLISGLGVTAGAHRLWSHRAYEAKWPLRLVLAIWHCIAIQRNIYTWCVDHRLHHKYCATDADPHNVRRGFFYAHIGWLLLSRPKEVIKKEKLINYDDLLNDPIVRFQKQYYVILVAIFSIILPTIVPYYCWHETLIKSFFIVVILRTLVSFHVAFMVNSVAHICGDQPYDTHIDARDNLIISVSAIGEGFHNFHHTFPQDYATSEWGCSFNISTLFIDLCYYLGLAYNLKSTSKSKIKQRKLRTGSKHLCQASGGQH